jgi:hypothetical protein
MPNAIWKGLLRSPEINSAISRRSLLKYFGAATAAAHLPAAAPTQPDSFSRILIETEHAQIVPTAASWLQNGLTSIEFLHGLQLAAARTISPYPAVGFKFHAAMAPQSFWLTSEALNGQNRRLPLLWSADYYKRAQARQLAQQPDWTLDRALITPKASGMRAFAQAMEAWDLDNAEATLVALLAERSSQALFDPLFEYGVRDYRDIGHKAIYAANCHRMLALTGGEDASVVLRSLLHALLNHHGEANPAETDSWRTASWRRAVAAAQTLPIRPHRRSDIEVARRTLAAIRNANAESVIGWLAGRAREGASPQALWDGIILAAGELTLRGGGFVALHANTTANACYYAYRHSHSEQTRARLLLQSGALMTHFADSVGATKLPQRFIDALPPMTPRTTRSVDHQVFHALDEGRLRAAQVLLGFIEAGQPVQQVIALARHYLIHKASGVHDFKYLEALVENTGWLSPPLRSRYLCTGAFWFKGADEPENDIVRQAESLFGKT